MTTLSAESAPHESVLTHLNRVRSLPALPTVAAKIVNQFNDEFADGNTVADTVAEDPGISARLIGLANSAYFGLARPVTDLREVVNRVLGVDSVRSMSLALAMNRTLDTRACPAFDAERFWRHSLGTASACKRFAKLRDDASSNQREGAYALGLCHNLGMLAMAALEPKRLTAVLSDRLDLNFKDRFIAHFECDVETLTLALAEHWALPTILIDPYRERAQGDNRSTMASVLAAAIRLSDLESDGCELHAIDLSNDDEFRWLGVPPERIASAALPTDRQKHALDEAAKVLAH